MVGEAKLGYHSVQYSLRWRLKQQAIETLAVARELRVRGASYRLPPIRITNEYIVHCFLSEYFFFLRPMTKPESEYRVGLHDYAPVETQVRIFPKYYRKCRSFGVSVLFITGFRSILRNLANDWVI